MESKKTRKQGQIENGSRMRRLGSRSRNSYTDIYNNSCQDEARFRPKFRTGNREKQAQNGVPHHHTTNDF